VYPNPVTTNLFIQDVEQFNYLSICTVAGKFMAYKKIESLGQGIDFSVFSNGDYILKLDGNSARKIIRVVKE
jgi:hypothetical protein